MDGAPGFCNNPLLFVRFFQIADSKGETRGGVSGPRCASIAELNDARKLGIARGAVGVCWGVVGREPAVWKRGVVGSGETAVWKSAVGSGEMAVWKSGDGARGEIGRVGDRARGERDDIGAGVTTRLGEAYMFGFGKSLCEKKGCASACLAVNRLVGSFSSKHLTKSFA